MLDWDDPLTTPKKNQPAQLKLVVPKEQAKTVDIPSNASPINVDDKRVINGMADINQLAPFKYPWAWEYFLNANKNHWTPLDINMAQDVHDYNHKLTLEERHVYENVLAYLTTSDILAMRNIGLAVMEKMSAPELQIYQARQVYEEALHCYEEGTEVLTNKGFIDFRDIQDDTLIAQYHQDGSITFVSHLGVTADDFDGELIHFKSAVYHSSVTPNHRCVSFNIRKNNTLEITLAEELSPSNRDFPVAGKISGNEAITLTPLDQLRIAYQADGTIRNNGNITEDGTIAYRWHLHKERKVERLIALLNTLDLRYTQYAEYIEVWIPASFNFRKDFSFVDLAKISYQWARDFIEELTLWDGSKSSDMIRYSSTNVDCINIAIAIGALANYRVGTHIAETSAETPYYTLNFIERTKVSGRSINKSTKAYKGKVYSVGVPSTMIITRYKHKVCISGNTWTYQHCIETIGLDQSEIYNRYRVVPEIYGKIQIANRRLNAALRSDINLRNRDDLHEFVMSYLFFGSIFEGCWFYNGFTPIFALQRRGLMKGTAEQLQYIMRDEVMHCSFGIRVVKQIIREENITLDQTQIRQMWDEAEAAEKAYANYLLKDPILGYSAEDHIEQFRFIANRRARQLNLPDEPFPNAENRLPWLEEQANLRKEKNFFETRVTEYQTGGALNWD
jgi:ribonucleotide reductase beta subunit family protein with ferritin-like domain